MAQPATSASPTKETFVALPTGNKGVELTALDGRTQQAYQRRPPPREEMQDASCADRTKKCCSKFYYELDKFCEVLCCEVCD